MSLYIGTYTYDVYIRFMLFYAMIIFQGYSQRGCNITLHDRFLYKYLMGTPFSTPFKHTFNVQKENTNQKLHNSFGYIISRKTLYMSILEC